MQSHVQRKRVDNDSLYSPNNKGLTHSPWSRGNRRVREENTLMCWKQTSHPHWLCSARTVPVQASAAKMSVRSIIFKWKVSLMNNRSANHSRFFSSCFKIRFINWDIQRDVTKPETERFKRKQMPHCLRVFFWKIESVSFILIPSASNFVKKRAFS